jgi:hypothetical protein
VRGPWRFSFEEYLTKKNFHNFQTKKIACVEDLDTAKRVLDKSFAMVGVMEQFEEFLVLFQREFGGAGFDIGFRRHNVQRVQKTDYLERFGDVIKENNKVDMELYKHVVEVIMPRQREKFGIGLHEAVAEFNAQNISREEASSFHIVTHKLLQRFYVDIAAGIIRRRFGLPWGGPY